MFGIYSVYEAMSTGFCSVERFSYGTKGLLGNFPTTRPGQGAPRLEERGVRRSGWEATWEEGGGGRPGGKFGYGDDEAMLWIGTLPCRAKCDQARY
jgi:hypothetical protein